MTVLFWLTIVAVGLLITALAVALLLVVWLLAQTTRSLGDVAAAISTIADRTSAIGPRLTEINQGLSGVRDLLPPAAGRVGETSHRVVHSSEVRR